MKLKVENISKSYGSLKAVSNLSFSVPAGEVVGFLGPNGAGKSTTMKIITGVMPPTSGNVLLDDINGFDHPMEYKRKVGYLPELPPLYPAMIVSDYLKFAAEIREVPSRKIQASIDRVVEFAALEAVHHRIIGNLSKGYRQRVGIAQALIHDPEVLVLDEPTVGLDPVQIVEIRELIKSLAKERTIILSTHILPEVSAICKRIIMINHGKIAGDGSEQELWKLIPGATDMKLSLKGPREKIEDVFRKETSIDSFTCIHEQNSILTYSITHSPKGDSRDTITTSLAGINCQIYELKPPGRTLEEVFVHLTAGGGTMEPSNKQLQNSAMSEGVVHE